MEKFIFNPTKNISTNYSVLNAKNKEVERKFKEEAGGGNVGNGVEVKIQGLENIINFLKEKPLLWFAIPEAIGGLSGKYE